MEHTATQNNLGPERAHGVASFEPLLAKTNNTENKCHRMYSISRCSTTETSAADLARISVLHKLSGLFSVISFISLENIYKCFLCSRSYLSTLIGHCCYVERPSSPTHQSVLGPGLCDAQQRGGRSTHKHKMIIYIIKSSLWRSSHISSVFSHTRH